MSRSHSMTVPPMAASARCGVLPVVRCLALGLLVALAAPSALPAQDFEYRLLDQTVLYGAGTGNATFTAQVEIVEYSTSPGYPNLVQGFSMGIGHDPAVLELVEVLQGPILDDMNGGLGPDFWAPTVLVEGMTLGVVFSFMTPQGIQFLDPVEVIGLHYETQPGVLQGVTLGLDTMLEWSSDLARWASGPTVENIVTVDGFTREAHQVNGTITLMPDGFLRGDCNEDGSTNLTDAVALLAFLFPFPPPAPVLPCARACDSNDDGNLNLPDVVTLLAALFGVPATPLPPPTGVCASDPTPDTLDCPGYMACP